jgi:Cdc6-like AAA superfamily ATPase
MELPHNPFDIIRTEDFNTRYNIIAQYFSNPKASYYSNLVRRGNVILVGTRGSGKTMLLKSLYLPVHIEILKKEGKDPRVHSLDFVGILINCERYEFKIFRQNVFRYHMNHDDEERVRNFWKQCMGHYFALFIIEEMLNTIINYGPEVGLDFTDSLYEEIFNEICEICQIDTQSDPSISLISLGELLKKKRKEFSRLMNKSILNLDYSIAENRFDLSAVIEIGNVLKKIPRFKDARFYILLDDFFYPNLANEQQKILLELIRVRNEPLAFKIATIPGGMVFEDDSGFELMPRGDEFIIESIEYPELGERSDYYKLIKGIVNNRLKDYNLTADDLFQESGDSYKYDFLPKLKGKVKRGHVGPEYAGFGTLVHMSSGVIRTFLVLTKKILDEWLKKKNAERLEKAILPISIDTQTEIIQTESALFLDAIETREKGSLMLKLVHYIGNESRQRLLNNEEATEYIHLQIENYENIDQEAQEILTRAVTNNVFHSYQLGRRTTRRGIIPIKELILNRLLTPALRIPYRDRWRIDIKAEKLNEILGTSTPIDISYHKPLIQRTWSSEYCPVISGECARIDTNSEGQGCFYASPIRPDWTTFAKEFFAKQFDKFDVAIEHPPKGELTCKICEMIHKNQFGIYELTDLNENVVFELALALSRKKHAFFIVNTDFPVNQIETLLGKEYIPYKVVEEEIEKISNEKIWSVVKSGQPPWNATVIDDVDITPEDNSVLLVMPEDRGFYERTLTAGVKNILEKELNYKVKYPMQSSTGNLFRNLIRDVKGAQYCLIDTTKLPTYQSSEGRFSPRVLDYLNRVFIFGIAVGLRKIILHGYNVSFNKKIFTDMQGHCHFEYSDTVLFDEIRTRVPEVFQ